MAETFIFKIPIQQTWLNTYIVLVFSADTTVIFPSNSVIIDLADFCTGINSDRLHTEDFRRPVAGKA